MITADIKKRQPLPQITAAVITESVIFGSIPANEIRYKYITFQVKNQYLRRI